MDKETRNGYLKLSQSGIRNLTVELFHFDLLMAKKRGGDKDATLFAFEADFTNQEADKIKLAVDFLNMVDEITDCMEILNGRMSNE